MSIKTCRHCEIQFQRPDAAPVPDDRCERCHEEIEASRLSRQLDGILYAMTADQGLRSLRAALKGA